MTIRTRGFGVDEKRVKSLMDRYCRGCTLYHRLLATSSPHRITGSIDESLNEIGEVNK